MRILWLSWKDTGHPQAGGAELVTSELIKGLVRDGHEVTLLTSGYAGAHQESTSDGFRTIRVGGRVSVYWHAYRYAKRHLSKWPEYVVEEINTIPFCSRLYYRKTPRVMFFHMLCREIWFYQLPMPASLIGFLLEPIYLRFLAADKAIAMSESTKADLGRYGFKVENVTVISEGIQLEPLLDSANIEKFNAPTIVSLGSIRPMKRTIDQVRAFEFAKAHIPSLQMKIAGDGSGNYGNKVLEAIKSSPFSSDIEYLGRISPEQKTSLLQKAHLITVTSVKEGWGLIVTEAASQGTPAAVYDVDGLRDSVRHNKTGSVCKENTPEALATEITKLLSDEPHYKTLQRNALQWSKTITFQTSYKQFSKEITS